jgi:LCP family protein required for cell wall assembly
MGKNGSNVDTMIFAHVDLSDQKITLLSVPRDLYYDGRKINATYGEKGIAAQVAAVENVVGYKVNHYALIDMYAFKDVIDLLGGVDVTLEEDLIDPTYKVCDGDVCSTLYYPAGSYHLNGTEALRVARSRHTTSDYSRAARQQLILDGLKTKAQTLGFGDAPTFLSIVNTVLGSLETDFTATEVLQDYFRYQNFELDSGYVLSTGNVLGNLPIPVDYVTSHATTTCINPADSSTCTTTYALDALQPKDGDWDAIKWYVRQIFQ